MAGIPDSTVKTIVLVHGGFVDGSGWEEVYKILKKDGYNVSIVQNPTISLADDVAVTKRVLATHSGPVILVGHSYGGAVITEAGNDPKVAGLVYITAFASDNGESVSSLIKDPPPGAPVPPILPPQDGFLFLDKAKFPASFAADVDAEKAAFMADSQVPWGVEALSGTISRGGMENQAELVFGRHRGQDDSTAGPAFHVQARGFDSRRGCGQPRDLCVAAKRRRHAHCQGGQRSKTGGALSARTPRVRLALQSARGLDALQDATALRRTPRPRRPCQLRRVRSSLSKPRQAVVFGSGNPPGLIGYRGKVPVGWVSVGPREQVREAQALARDEGGR